MKRNIILPFLQILEKYSNEGFPFLLQAFNIPKYLEDLTGLTKLMEDTKLLEVWKIRTSFKMIEFISSIALYARM